MNIIEHMWKVASNNPNHDTNWHDPVIEKFAELVAAHEREECAKIAELAEPYQTADLIRARGEA